MKRVIYCSFILSFFFNSFSFAQPINLEVELLGRETGLSNSNATCITQDQNGLIWIGTENGLNCFDGYSMKVYRSIANDSLSLPNNNIHALFSDSRGTLWIGTSTFLCSYVPAYDHFRIYDLTQIIKDTEVFEVVAINENFDHDVFFSDANQIIRYNYSSDSFDSFINNVQGDISSFLFDSTNHVWMGTLKDGGLYYLNQKGEVEKRYLIDENAKSSLKSNSIFDLALHKNKLWIATEGGGINCLDLENKEFKQYPVNNYYENYARLTYVDNDNRLWTCDYTGIKLYDEKQDQFYAYYDYTDHNHPSSIPSNATSIFQDIQGNYWTLHHPGGVGYSPVNRGIQKFTGNIDDYWHTSKDNILSIEEDGIGNLWITNPFNGIDVFYWSKAETFRFDHDLENINSLGEGATFDVHWDGEVMWVATYRGGLQYIDKSLNRFISYRNNPDDTTTIAGDDVRSVTSDFDGNLWISVHGKGIDKFDRKSKTFTHYNSHKNNLSNNWTFEALVDSYGEIWVATAWGLNRLGKSAQKFESYFSDPKDTNSLCGSAIVTVFQDELDRIWIGTSEGLNLYDRNNDKFIRVCGPLQGKFICGILDDKDNNLWVSTQDGLYSYNPTNKSFKRFDEADGIPSAEFNPRSTFKNERNDLFFGSIKGLIIINPDKLNYNTKAPNVLLSGLRLFNEEITSFGNNSILDRNISMADRVNLNYKQNMLTFEFTAINMIQPEKNQYAYKMDGFDKEWRYIGSKREATYTNLSPGTYVFRVIASNNDGYWNEEGASIEVIISPPWWMTWWFRVLIVIIVIYLVAAIVIIRNRQLIRQKAKLTEKVKLGTKEMRDKNQLLLKQTEYLNENNVLLEKRQEEIIAQSEKLQELNTTKDRLFSIIAHDLTSPFNTILGFTEIFSRNQDKLSNKEKISIATTINDSAHKVHGLLDNLLNWARSQTERIQYTPKMIEIEKIFAETIQLYELRIQEKEIKMFIDNKENLKVNADADMLKTVMRNLISNAIKFTQRGGQISISAISDNENAIISVSDTGIGMKPEMIDKLFDMKTSYSTQGTDGEKGSGIGLMLTRDFVQRNKGSLGVDSTPGKGTTFMFTLPLV